MALPLGMILLELHFRTFKHFSISASNISFAKEEKDLCHFLYGWHTNGNSLTARQVTTVDWKLNNIFASVTSGQNIITFILEYNFTSDIPIGITRLTRYFWKKQDPRKKL